jgi:hypothetical protein
MKCLKESIVPAYCSVANHKSGNIFASLQKASTSATVSLLLLWVGEPRAHYVSMVTGATESVMGSSLWS